jgi:hypothetical protein
MEMPGPPRRKGGARRSVGAESLIDEPGRAPGRRLWARLADAVRTAAQRPLPRLAWPSRRQIAWGGAIAAGLAVLLIGGLHLLAASLVRQKIAQAETGSVDGIDIAFDGSRARMFSIGGAHVRLRQAGGGTSDAPAIASDPIDARIVTPDWMLVADASGGVEAIRDGRRVALHHRLKAIDTGSRGALTGLFGDSANATLLDRMLQIDPLLIDAADRPQRDGGWQLCDNCPEMLALGKGWSILPIADTTGTPRFQLTATGTMSIARAPISRAEWQACERARGCPAATEDGSGAIRTDAGGAKRYIAWLNQMAAQTPYRFGPVGADQRALVASLAAAGFVATAGAEWLCADDAGSRTGACAFEPSDPDQAAARLPLRIAVVGGR